MSTVNSQMIPAPPCAAFIRFVALGPVYFAIVIFSKEELDGGRGNY